MIAGPGGKLRRSHSLAAHLLLLGVAVVWGTTFALVKAALADASPMIFNLLRMTLAFAALVAINLPDLRQLKPADLKLGAAAGLFLGLGYQLQTTGLMYTTASRAAFITGLVVVMVPLMSAIPGLRPRPGGRRSSLAEAGSAFAEKIAPAERSFPLPDFASSQRIESQPSSRLDSPADDTSGLRPNLDTYVGALVAFVGLALLTSPQATGPEPFSGIHLGEWLCLGCAVAFAAHLLALAKAASRVSARRLGTLQIGFAAVVMLVTLPLGGPLRFHSAGVLWLALAVTSVLATAAAFTIQSWAQQHLPASHTALILTLEPIFAWLTSLFFLGEHLGRRGILGAFLILAGILVAELRPVTHGRNQPLPLTGA
jgi:drug/metabolite transporter (DMT)-like permease